MAQKPGWDTKIDRAIKRMEGDSIRSGLKAAAITLQDIIRQELEEGYTSKQYSKGIVAQTVVRGRPTTRKIWVGSPSTVANLWELGHVNQFTEKYERVEVFRPSLEQNARELAWIFATRFIEKLEEIAPKRGARLARRLTKAGVGRSTHRRLSRGLAGLGVEGGT